MVFIEDREGVFDAPIDKVWKLAKAHSTEGAKIHPDAKNVVTEMINEQVFINSWEEEIKGQPIRIKMKGTIFYPLGVTFEAIEEPFAGSTYFIYYIPLDNNKTNVVVAGDFRSQSIDPVVDDDKSLSDIVLSKFEKVFYEDCEYLKKI